MSSVISKRVEEIESFGYSVVETRMDAQIHEIKYKFYCENGHIRDVRWGGWTSGKKECFECEQERKVGEKVSSFESKGFEYIGFDVDIHNNKHYILKCERGHTKRVMWSYWVKGRDKCFACVRESDIKGLLPVLRSYNLTPLHLDSIEGIGSTILCEDIDGYIVKVRMSSLGKNTPSPWTKNEYAITNLNRLMNIINDWGITILNPEKYKTVHTRLKGIDREGYLYELRPANMICQGHKPNWLYRNPYGIQNINKHCEIHRPEYTCISDTYKNNSSLLKFKFLGEADDDFSEDDRIFEMDFSHFQRGQGHPTLNMSKGEEKIRTFLTSNNIRFESQYIDIKCKNEYPLRFDFAVYDKNDNLFCLIEYDGKQHFEPIDFFGGESAFLVLQGNDNIKNQFCKDKEIRLLRIAYFEHRDIEPILDRELQAVIDNYKTDVIV